MVLRNLDWNQIVERLSGFATSSDGAARLQSMEPLSGPEYALESFEKIEEALSLLNFGPRPLMESLDLYHMWMDRLVKGAILKPLEIKDIRFFLRETLELENLLRSPGGKWSHLLLGELIPAAPPISAIEHLITESGDIRTDASETLYRLSREKDEQIREIQRILDQIVKNHEMEGVLQDRYVTTREGRWVIPVKSGMQHSMGGIIHASSQSKQTVFMEPEETVRLNNRLKEIDAEIEAEIERLLIQISDYFRTLVEPITRSRVALLEADVVFAKAQLTAALDSHRCLFHPKKVDLRGLRHPLMVLGREAVIANDVALTYDRGVLLLSGPNAGGKTVLLKSVGLAAQMARCGLPICAEESSSLPFFDSIVVGIGDAQNVDDHLSTFAAHLKVLGEASKLIGPQNLLLIDEICGSTDPEEGSALARSFIERFASNGTFAVVTSHLGPLKMGWDEKSRVVNGSLEYDSKSGRPTFHFLLGVAGQSLALQMAERVGVDSSLIKRAVSLLSPEVKSQYQSMKEMEDLKAELFHLRKELVQEKERASEQRRRYLKLIEQFRVERENWMNRLIKKAEKNLDEIMQQEGAREILERHRRTSEIRSEFPTVVKHAITKSALQKPDSLESFERIFPPGSTVFVETIGRGGVVQGKPNAKGEVPVLSESMRVVVPWTEISPPKGSMGRTTSPGLRLRYEVSEGMRVVDLRGRRVEEAISILEDQLDAATVNSEDRLKVIHGHGTDALKKAIRNHLSRSVYIKSWSSGGAHSGGDGVTLVEL